MCFQGTIPKQHVEHVQVVRYRNGYALLGIDDGHLWDEEKYFFLTRAEADTAKVLLDRELQIYHELGERRDEFVAQLIAEG